MEWIILAIFGISLSVWWVISELWTAISKSSSNDDFSSPEDIDSEDSEDDEWDQDEEDEITLICPHCNQTIEEPVVSEKDDDDGNTWSLCGCEHCNKVLGTTI